MLVKKEKFHFELVRFYTAELVSAIEEMRKHNIVHRDIKPGNILLDSNLHLKLSDFGEAKKLSEEGIKRAKTDIEQISNSSIDNEVDFNNDEEEGNANTFAGTPLYISPEMLNLNISIPEMDLWALG
mmetsp:Transcript_26868/g.23723  ORF Transcript_26868/g.23723 Transcript_26868/m.23723 type:complete len:127 (+) Transcript_26868:389-769(+)